MTKLSDSQSLPTLRTGPRKRQKRYGQMVMFNVIVPLLLLGLGGFVVFKLGTVEPAERPDPDLTRTGRLKSLPPVRVVALDSLKTTGQQLRLGVDGTVVPYRESRVAAEVAGRVVFKADECEAGSYVTTDQLLMKLDPTDYELEIQRLTQLQQQEYQAIGEADQEMVNTQRLIDVARQDMQLQQQEVDRQNALPAGFASKAEIDQANRALLAAKQQWVTAENQLDLLKKKRVRLESSERLAATQLKVAEINLKRCEIRAPIDGVIVNEDADLNTFVPRGNLLVTIEDTSKVEVATSLRMDQLYWVLNQGGSEPSELSRGYDLPETPAIIEYELSGREGMVYRWKGRLLSYDGIGVDATTRTAPVRVVVDNPTEYIDQNGKVHHLSGGTALVRGMFVRVNLLLKPQGTLVAIPARALQPGNRVFQFVHDESVLKLGQQGSASTTKADSDVADSSDGQPDEPNDDEIPFDPNHWEPGRVVIRRNIHPVDTLAIGDDISSDSKDRIWICEVRDEVLGQGSFVVVSPIGSIDEQGMPARIERAGETLDANRSTESPAAPQTAVTHNQPAKEA